MLDALERHFPEQAEWTRPEGGLFVWATLPDYIDTTDLLAKALRENVAFVPGRAAYVDGRGASSMRLNFSASGEDELREGIRRIGGVVVTSRSRSTRRSPASTASSPSRGRTRATMPRRRGRPAARSAMKVAVLKGGSSLERGVSLRSAARVEDALGALGHEAIGIDVGQDLVSAAARRAARRRLHRPARPGRRGRHRPGAARDPRPPLHRARRRRLRALHGQGRRQARDPRGRAPHAGLGRLQRDRLPRARRRRHARGDRGAARLPAGRQAGEPGLLARRRVRLLPRRGSRRRWSPPSATTTGCCSSATSRAGSWRSACSAARRCPSSRRSRARRTSSTSRPATRSGAPSTSARRSSARRRPERVQELAARTYETLGCSGFARVDLMLGEDGPAGARGERDPRPHRHQPLPDGRRGGGDRLHRAGRADPRARRGSGRRARRRSPV